VSDPTALAAAVDTLQMQSIDLAVDSNLDQYAPSTVAVQYLNAIAQVTG
jgi:hypothetical protein